MLYVAVYISIDRKYKNSRPDTKSEIQRNLSSRIIGNLLQTDPSGNLSVIPAPPADQQNYLLTGGGGWAKLGLGLTGETWNELTTSKSTGKNYTNNNPYPISIAVTLASDTGSSNVYILAGKLPNPINIKLAHYSCTASKSTVSLNAIIPPGYTYNVTTGLPDGSCNTGYELY